jgi:hypothetical protein
VSYASRVQTLALLRLRLQSAKLRRLIATITGSERSCWRFPLSMTRVELELATKNYVAHARVEGQDDPQGASWCCPRH